MTTNPSLMDVVTSTPANLAHTCILSLCTDPCLHPGPHMKDRVEPVVLPAASCGHKHMADTAFGTWLAAGAEWVTIGRYEEVATLVYVASQDTFYYASPGCILSAKCPRHTIFIGQFILDGSDLTPRVLVHDLVRMQGTSFSDMPPRERYGCLQQLSGCLGPLCTVQWAGECSVLKGELASGRFKVPHAVRAVVALTSVPGRLKIMD